MKMHKIFNLVFAFVFIFSLLGTPVPVFATSQASIQSAPFTSCADVTDIPQEECEVLVALYNNTDGANWVANTNWLTTNMPCYWLGVGCDGNLPFHVTVLDLHDNRLSGSIPTELGNLTQLMALNLSDNQLSGNIPAELGNLT